MQPTFTTIREARRWASVFLQEHNREERVADLLLEHCLGLTFAQLLAYELDSFPLAQRETFVNSVQAHATTGIPVQHLIGHAHFYGREFNVNSHVLIPRPETEELVLGVIEWMNNTGFYNPAIIDVGTGSGVIAITLALETEAEVVATDLSSDAIKVARQNAQKHEVAVEFLEGSFLDPVKNRNIDILVSNPPYIAYEEKQEMEDTVVNFDPELALFAEKKGLAAYEAILNQIDKQPSLIAFEIGHKQGAAVQQLIKEKFPAAVVDVKQDINKKDRMVFASHPNFL